MARITLRGGHLNLNITAAVKEFHEACDMPVYNEPQVGICSIHDNERRKLRRSLIGEEYAEYVKAEKSNSIVDIADSLADMMYVIAGAGLEYGIDLDAVMVEIHRSNMSKVNATTGKIVRREDGKILKPDGWTPPDVRGVLFSWLRANKREEGGREVP
jgi:predicted HAD superfamily Cof-like phosphohydrolase